MDAALAAAIEACVQRATGREARVTGSRPVSGGCINHARLVDLADGRRVFVKSNPDPLPGLFEREAEGLAALAAAGSVRVPEVIGLGAEPVPFLVLEAIEVGQPGRAFDAVLGRQVAALHRSATAERFGFDRDNWLGSTPQPNAWSDRWVEFWRDRRLGHLLGLLRAAGRSDAMLDRLADRLLDRLDDHLAEPAEPPSLLHGDLWRGNVLADAAGQPVLLDPAAYYGRREAELAMPALFGRFDESFWAAYDETWPLAEGWQRRLAVYQLYHLLNHLLIFGESYRGQCLAALRGLVT